ncbi:MAG TPA: ParB/RepB/Spo0J family partition protein, partial [Candidatus Caenarcaniphilales bacterium]
MNLSKKNQPYTSKLKGVAALIGEPAASAAQFADVNSIHVSNQQPRRYFDPEKLKQLVLSVKEHGILEPLLVRPMPNNEYELVAGERRYRAAQAAQLTQVPVVVKVLGDEEALHLALVENLQREDLNPIEETEGILQLLGLHLEVAVADVVGLLHRMRNEIKGNVNQNVLVSPEGEKIQAFFNTFGLMSWESFVSSRIPLLSLPTEIMEALRQGRLAYTKAQAIARLKDESK